MKNFLPSIGALRAFEAAARHSSFTRAADEMNITQTAVSHQIKTLEDQLGIRLFVRYRNTLKLTEAAQAYILPVRTVIETLAKATETIVHTEPDSVLTVNSLASFTFKCLLPRLSCFRELHPEIKLRISASASFEEFERKVADISIKRGDGHWPGMRVDKMFSHLVYPVCSPGLLSDNPLHRPSDLANHVIIRSGSSFFLEDSWPVWLRAAGVSDLVLGSPLTFEYALPAFEAAAQGLGVALGWDRFLEPDFIAGRLVRPFETTAESGLGYYVVSLTATAGRPKVRQFRDWLLDTFRGTANLAAGRHASFG